MTPGQMYDALLVYAMRWPFSITSGYRTIQRNAAVGGGSNSRHMLGLAFDLVFDTALDGSDCRAAMRDDHPEWDVIHESDHTHIEWDPD